MLTCDITPYNFLTFSVEHYYKDFDIQTAAMITCILKEHSNRTKQLIKLGNQQLKRPMPKNHRPLQNKRLRWEKYHDKLLKLVPNFVVKSNRPVEREEVYKYLGESRFLERKDGGRKRHLQEKPSLEPVEESDSPPETLKSPSVFQMPVDEEYHDEQEWLEEKYESIRTEYMIILCQWGMLNKITELNKYRKLNEKNLLIKRK